MSEYQVIARKWRPQSFSDVVGQQHVVRTLKNAIQQNRTAHAYLFVGPRGVGKTTLARIFAKAMNCADPQNGEPCCKCESCLAIAQDRSLDVLEVDAASRNSTNDMRELSEDVLTRPVGGKYKIYIIDEVHMLSKQAWNVLLKTVEEPPGHVKFIFATTEVHQVLPTIISRCQRFDLLPIPTKLIAERLRLIADTEKVQIRQDAIDAIARAAEGGMRDAQSLLDQMIAFFSQAGDEITGEQVLSLFGLTDRNDLDKLLDALITNDPGAAVTIIGKLSRRGKNLETLFDDLLGALRIAQLCSILPNPGELLDEGVETINHYRALAGRTTPAILQTLLETLAPVGRVLHDALNKQVYLETLLLKAMREAHAVRLDDIMRRLNQLRTAGELQFLDQLPPAGPLAALPPAAPVQIPVTVEEKKTEVEPVKPAEAPLPPEETAAVEPPGPVEPEIAIKDKPVIQSEPAADIPEEPVIQSEPAADIPEEPVIQNEPAVDIPVEQVTQNEPEPQVTTEEYPSEAPVIEEISPAPVPVVPVPDTVDTVCVTAETPAEPENLPEETEDEDISAPATPQPLVTEQQEMTVQNSAPPGNHIRESVINKDSSELRSILNDPAVKNIVDLFDGTVVDIHR